MNTGIIPEESENNQNNKEDEQNTLENGSQKVPVRGINDKVSGSSQILGNPKSALNPNNFNMIPEELLIEKSKKWRQLNTKRFSQKRKFGFVEGQKDKLPCEVLR